MLLCEWLRIHSVSAFHSWLHIRMVWGVLKKICWYLGLPLDMLFHWSGMGPGWACPAARSEKQCTQWIPVEDISFSCKGSVLSSEELVCFILMNDVNLVNGFFSFLFRFSRKLRPNLWSNAGNWGGLFSLHDCTLTFALFDSIYTSLTSCLWFYSAVFIF